MNTLIESCVKHKGNDHIKARVVCSLVQLTKPTLNSHIIGVMLQRVDNSCVGNWMPTINLALKEY